MAKLTLSALILGERSQVYEYVTIYGSQGPTDLRSFREKYGTVISQQDSTMITQDEEELDPITWNCKFDYPTERLMEAIDARWATRRDMFEDDSGGTRWTVQFETNRSGLVGLVQQIFFFAITGNRIRKALIEPVIDHFQSGKH